MKYRLATADSAINQSHAHAHAGKTVELEPIRRGNRLLSGIALSTTTVAEGGPPVVIARLEALS